MNGNPTVRLAAMTRSAEICRCVKSEDLMAAFDRAMDAAESQDEMCSAAGEYLTGLRLADREHAIAIRAAEEMLTSDPARVLGHKPEFKPVPASG
jgi:hypothetical protein